MNGLAGFRASFRKAPVMLYYGAESEPCMLDGPVSPNGNKTLYNR